MLDGLASVCRRRSLQLLGVNSDERFCAGASRRLGHLFPRLPPRPGYVKHRQRLADTIEALIAEFAAILPARSTTCS